MPIHGTAAMNAFLDNNYGATKGPNAPASHEVVLFEGDPSIPAVDGGGVELDAVNCPGYARVTIANDAGWLAAADGMKRRAVLVQFPATTGEWLIDATHVAVLDASDEGWSCELSEPVVVTGAGDGPLVEVVIFFDESVMEPE